jgi:hypothetical protein
VTAEMSGGFPYAPPPWRYFELLNSLARKNPASRLSRAFPCERSLTSACYIPGDRCRGGGLRLCRHLRADGLH